MPPVAMDTVPAVVPPNTATLPAPGQATSAVPLNHLAVVVSQVPGPPPRAVPVMVGSHVYGWAGAAGATTRSASSATKGRTNWNFMGIRLRRVERMLDDGRLD